MIRGLGGFREQFAQLVQIQVALPDALGSAMVEFITQRAHFLAGNACAMLEVPCRWNPVLGFRERQK
jgi:hypothetical protein